MSIGGYNKKDLELLKKGFTTVNEMAKKILESTEVISKRNGRKHYETNDEYISIRNIDGYYI